MLVAQKVVSCSVKGCDYINQAKRLKKPVNLFRFPREPERCKKWAIAAGCLEKHNLLTGNSQSLYDSDERVCQNHFSDSMFLNAEKTRLQSDAIPIITDINQMSDITDNNSGLGGKKCCIISCGKQATERHLLPVSNRKNVFKSYLFCDDHYKKKVVKGKPKETISAKIISTNTVSNKKLTGGVIDGYLLKLPSTGPLQCAYKYCMNTEKTKDVCFFAFPENIPRFKEWANACGRKDLEVRTRGGGCKICSDHFTNDQFYPDSTRTLLKRSAVPIAYNTINQIEYIEEENSDEEKVDIDELMTFNNQTDLQVSSEVPSKILEPSASNNKATPKIVESGASSSKAATVSTFLSSTPNKTIVVVAPNNPPATPLQTYSTTPKTNVTVLNSQISNVQSNCKLNATISNAPLPKLNYFNQTAANPTNVTLLVANNNNGNTSIQNLKVVTDPALINLAKESNTLVKINEIVTKPTSAPVATTTTVSDSTPVKNLQPVKPDTEAIQDPVILRSRVREKLDKAGILKWSPFETTPDEAEIYTCVLKNNSVNFPGIGKKLVESDVRYTGRKRENPFNLYTYNMYPESFTKMHITEKSKGEKMRFHTAIIIDDDDEAEEMVIRQLLEQLKKKKPEMQTTTTTKPADLLVVNKSDMQTVSKPEAQAATNVDDVMEFEEDDDD